LIGAGLLVEQLGPSVRVPRDLWLRWEAQPAERLRASRPRLRGRSQLERPERGEDLLEASASLLLSDPSKALVLARKAEKASPQEEVYLGRAQYLSATALRLLGRPEEAESAFLAALDCLALSRRSLDRAFYCRSLALLRWEQGRLDEAEGLLERAVAAFSAVLAPLRFSGAAEIGPALVEEMGTTQALLGLFLAEGGDRVSALVTLQTAIETMDLERRPWLSVRACLALAEILAGRKKQDRAHAVLQEVFRLRPQVTEGWEQIVGRWWEGRVQARLGNYDDAVGLLRTVRLTFLEQRRVPEAALATLDVMLVSAETGRFAEARRAAKKFATWLGREEGAAEVVEALAEFQYDIAEFPASLRWCAKQRAAAIRRGMRFRGLRIDPLPFA